MASLWWDASTYQLPEAAEDIGEVYEGIQQGMQQLGWQDIAIEASDIHGYDAEHDAFVAVTYLEIGSSPTFYQVIMIGGGGDTPPEAQADIEAVQAIINNLEFL